MSTRNLGAALAPLLSVPQIDQCVLYGAGTLLRSNGRNVFVSRRADAPLPAAFLRKLLES